jgi:hypothetical protein
MANSRPTQNEAETATARMEGEKAVITCLIAAPTAGRAAEAVNPAALKEVVSRMHSNPKALEQNISLASSDFVTKNLETIKNIKAPEIKQKQDPDQDQEKRRGLGM